MFTYIFLSIASVMAVLLPVLTLAVVIFLVNSNRNREAGFFHLVPYCMVLVIVADVLFSGRVVNNESQILQNELTRSSASIWMVRFCTILMIAISFERIVNFLIQNKHPFGRNIYLSLTFLLFWVGSVGLNGLFSAHPHFSHDYLYTLFIALGLFTLSKVEVLLFLKALRNALFIFLIASFLLILVNPLMVLHTTYNQGYIPGMPRMAGLAAHAVTFGVLTLSFLILALKFPFNSKNSQRVALLITFAGLVLAQSKTVWITTFQVFSVLIFFKVRANINGQPLLRSQSILALLASIILITCLIVIGSVFGGVVDKISSFLSSKEGQQLLTLTGRDIIWDFSLSEWAKYPWFGYGPSFLNFDHRVLIGLLNAIHAHNQFVDLLARSGLIGLLSVIPYLMVIIFCIFKQNDNVRDLAVVSFLIVLNRCVSEVPLSLYGYGHEFLIHLFMLAPLLLFDNRESKRTVNPA